MPSPTKKPALPKNPTTHDRWRMMIYQAAKGQDHSLAELGRGCHLNRSQISRFIGGTRNVTSAQLADIFDYLDLKVMPK